MILNISSYIYCTYVFSPLWDVYSYFLYIFLLDCLCYWYVDIFIYFDSNSLKTMYLS